MGRNKYTYKRSNNHLFYFKHEEDEPELLHIFVRHLTEPQDAIVSFFTGKTEWNERHDRYETKSDTHTVFWLWLDKRKKRVLIISCFQNEKEE